MTPRCTSRGFPVYVLMILGFGPAAFGQTGFVNWESPHVSPIALTPSGGRLLAVNTADNRLEIFALADGDLIHEASVPVGLDPVSVRARSNTEAWVVNHLSDSISIVDLPTARVVRTFQTGDEPTDVVFAGAPQRGFVSVSQLNQVRVFDPDNLGVAPTIINIQGEDPRAMAVSADGTRVYAAIFESGNPTTAVRQQDVSNPAGPYGGLNPPPNAGTAFNPPIAAGLPAPPPVAMIVRRNGTGQWLDDNNRNWSQFVGWNLSDHDVAIIDTASLTVTYANGMLTTPMAIGVRPDGTVSVVGTEARNELRFEPNVNGVFVRVEMGSFNPATPAATSAVDLNPHLTYTSPSIPAAQRVDSIGDPRAIVWHTTNGRAYVAGMGSNNVVVTDATGARFGRIDVGEGPTGLVLNAPGTRLYVLNKFEASISVVDTGAATELERVSFFDPTPSAIKDGRPFLYDTHQTSGLGHLACASCHIDGRTDFLGWDLGNPAGAMKPFNQTCRQPTCDDWHPMKGPMVTQTLVGIVGTEPLHWRGDRENLAAFAPAFTGLQGADAEPSAAELQQFTDFIATIKFPPNPNRNIDMTFPPLLPVTGGNGNAANGQNLFVNVPTLAGATCTACHGPVPGPGTNQTIDDPGLPAAPQPLKMAQLRNMHEKTGWLRTSQQANRGFGFNHHSNHDTLNELLTIGFALGAQGRRDVEAFLFCFSTDTHAAVGQQITFNGPNNNDAQLLARLNIFITLADAGSVGLVVHGRQGGLDRGYVYLGPATPNAFQADRASEAISSDALRNSAAAGSELTFTVVPLGTEVRIGIDRDADGSLDRDESDSCGDPADADIGPVAKGDLNADTSVDLDDAPLFADVMVDPSSATAQEICAADANGDGVTDGLDIAAFISAILSP